jgi:phospholipase/carboxylesterase
MIYTIASKKKPCEKLVILFHGYGSDGENLIELGEYWGRELPQVEFVSPHAPQVCEQGGAGYQWFSLLDWSLEAMAQGAHKAGPWLEAFIEEELKKRDLTYGDLVLMGFSQGAMMALHMGMTLCLSGRVCAGIMGYSGVFVDAVENFPPQFIYPPILLVHGDEDSVVEVEYGHEAARSLKRIAPLVELFISQGGGHSIDAHGLALGAKFLKSTFKQQSEDA